MSLTVLEKKPWALTIDTKEITLPSTGKKITLVPYLVKEEKLIIMGKESEDPKDFFNNLRQVVVNCVISPKDFDVNNMAYTDFAFVIVNLRQMSKGESIKINLTCMFDECKEKEVKTFMMDKIVKESKRKNKSNIVMITDVLGVELKKTTVGFMQDVTYGDLRTKKSAEFNFEFAVRHTVAILKGEERFDNLSKEDIADFYNHLNTDKYAEIIDWLYDEDELKIEVDWTCPKCSFKNKISEDNVLRFLEF